MREADLTCKTKRQFKATTHSKHKLPIAPNVLDRQFTVAQPNQVYAGDITYIHTQKGNKRQKAEKEVVREMFQMEWKRAKGMKGRGP